MAKDGRLPVQALAGDPETASRRDPALAVAFRGAMRQLGTTHLVYPAFTSRADSGAPSRPRSAPLRALPDAVGALLRVGEDLLTQCLFFPIHGFPH